MSNKLINVFLVNYTDNGSTQTKIKLGKYTEQEQQDFISKISKNEFSGDNCSFNVHHDRFLTHVSASGKCKQFVPMHNQNKKNELIIEIIPDMDNNECWAMCNTACPKCIQDGGCQSWPIKQLIGLTFLKNKYMKQQ